ncbi:MAG: AIPR family protein [Bacteroidetes bacterium]|nr:AIPR family protein [Bacteroidota bacterium]
MSITQLDKKELNKYYIEFSSKYGGMKEDYFAFLYLTKKFGKGIGLLAQQVAFGGNDYGIDGYYIDKDTRNFYLFQFKWSENHNLFKESLERLTKAGLERIFGDPYQDPGMNELLVSLKNELFEYKNLIDKIYIQFIFKGNVEDAENSSGLNYLREELENKKWLIDKYFGDKKVDLIFEFISDKKTSTRTQPVETHTLSISSFVEHSIDNKQKMYIGFVPIYELDRIYQTLNLKFLNRNIRAGLSDENPPNRKIREALQDIAINKGITPDIFPFNHNGITLAVERIKTTNNKVEVKVPRLLNGAQTIRSVRKFLEDNSEHPEFDESIFKEIKVLTKFVVDTVTSNFITTVTICNNRQNPVEPWHLRANDKIQCDIQDKFLYDLSIYYSRQENAFENLTDSDLEEMGVEDHRDIEIKPLAKTFLAIQGEIDKISRLTDVFENQKFYENTFRASYLKSDFSKLLLSYKILLLLNPVIRQMREAGPEYLYYGLNRARNVIAALLIQGTLNDGKLEQLKEWYGYSLRREADYKEYLTKLGKNKILPIIKEVLKEKIYRKKLDEEKYSIFRTKEFFRRCMWVSEDWYGWSKKSI